jgi:hypothetical protein
MTAAHGLDRYLLSDWPAVMTRGWIDQLRAGRDVPEYGSREWLAADRGLQLASALIAAEAYRRQGLFLAQALEDELTASRALLDDADTRAYAELADRVTHYDRYDVEWWKHQSKLPTHAELLERRAS